MTDEILEKAKELKSEISDLKHLQYLLNSFNFSVKKDGRKKVKVFARKFPVEYEVEFPLELRGKILKLVDEYRFDKELEYQALGEEQRNG